MIMIHTLMRVLIALLLVSAMSETAWGGVTVISQSNYPWLKPGVYSDYKTALQFFPPYFVTPSGVLLWVGRNASAEASFGWMVIQRDNNMVTLRLSYQISGALSAANGTAFPFNYTRIIQVSVNLSTGVVYINGTLQGVAPYFWGPPLPSANQTFNTTVYIGGEPALDEGVVTQPALGKLPEAVNVSGSQFTKSIFMYSVDYVSYGSSQDYQVGFLYFNSSVCIAPCQTPSFIPSISGGIYDYYNGLALSFGGPEYPVNRTVCPIEHHTPVNCGYVSFGTPLGAYFRSGNTMFYLVATNVPLLPNGGTSRVPVYVVVGVVLAIGVALTIYVWRTRISVR